MLRFPDYDPEILPDRRPKDDEVTGDGHQLSTMQLLIQKLEATNEEVTDV